MSWDDSWDDLQQLVEVQSIIEMGMVSEMSDETFRGLQDTHMQQIIMTGLRAHADGERGFDVKVGSSRFTVQLTPKARPPGAGLARLFALLLTAKAYKTYVEPVIADAQFEHTAAIAAGETWRAKWINLRMYALVVPGWVWAFGCRLAESWLRGRLG